MKGWENEAGDVHFKQQREFADNATIDGENVFYHMMIKIADDVSGT